MEVHKGRWKGQRVAIKYIRRSSSAEQSESHSNQAAIAYRQDMYDLNFELQIMSKPSLGKHRNITGLLAVCFDSIPEADGSCASVEPGLVVELAHEQYPDLALFFDHECNPHRPQRLPFQTSASFIVDIADGLQVLHDHDIVHADLKPGNVLIFPDTASPAGLIAKISDFGFVGMVTYTNDGKRAPLPGARPRGGTTEWNAPECLENEDPWAILGDHSLENPQYKASRDIYSFGLLSCYIALDGQSPKIYVPELAKVKLSDGMVGATEAQIKWHYQRPDVDDESSLKDLAMSIARQTLSLDPEKRIASVGALSIRSVLHHD
jgi:serine/threonine protein kinase